MRAEAENSGIRYEGTVDQWAILDVPSVQRAASRHTNSHADEAEIAFRLAVTRFGFELARKPYQRP